MNNEDNHDDRDPGKIFEVETRHAASEKLYNLMPSPGLHIPKAPQAIQTNCDLLSAVPLPPERVPATN